MNTTTIQIYIAVNDEGEYYLDKDNAIDAIDGLRGEIDCGAIRTVALNVTIGLPTVQEGAVTVPDEVGAEIKTEFAS